MVANRLVSWLCLMLVPLARPSVVLDADGEVIQRSAVDEPEPLVLRNGSKLDLEGLPSWDVHLSAPADVDAREWSPHDVRLTKVHDDVQLHYVRGFLRADEVRVLIALCDARAGWVRSPQKYQFHTGGGGGASDGATSDDGAGGDEETFVSDARTSSSCPLLWQHTYRRRWAELSDEQRTR